MTKQFFFNNFEIVIGSIIGIIGIIVGVAGIIVGIIISNNSTKTVKNFILTTLVKGTDIALQSSKVPGKKFKLSNLEKEALFKSEYDKVRKEVHLSMRGNEIVSASEDIYYDDRKDVIVIPNTIFIESSSSSVSTVAGDLTVK